jgi:sec-independent protein translocase protein TatC
MSDPEVLPSGVEPQANLAVANGEPGQGPEDDIKMSIWEHLGELRTRLTRASLGLLVGFLVCWGFRVKLLAWILLPYERTWAASGLPGKPELQTLAPTDVVIGYVQLSFVGAVVIAIPIIFYQLWSFISPGLYAKEKRYIYPFVFFSTLLFGSGVAFAYYIAFPFSFGYFFSQLGPVTDSGTMLTQRPTFEFYLDFVTRMLLAFGAVFELPLFITFLALAGIVTPRQLIKFSRWAILGSFILGAIVTPGPEITSQVVVSMALMTLYFMSIGFAFLVAKKPKKDV